jgi:tol-pal system protein YbgF
MKRILPIRAAAFAALASVALTGGALAQQDQRSPPNFLDNLFNRGESNSQQAQAPREAGPPDASDLIVRIDRLENALRQVTGTIEQLQYQNQQLQLQVQRLQGGAAAPNAAPAVTPGATPAVPPPSRPGSRSDVFDPSQRPTAPGAPRQLGNMAAPGPTAGNEPPIGAPGGRDAGAPLDLSTPGAMASAPALPAANAAPVQTAQPPVQSPPRNAAGPQLATLPPTASPQDEYDMAYGYVLHKDYALAEQAFRDFLKKYPDQHLVPDAQYWLGESLYQRQRYRDAAESFLAVSTKFEKSGKAPDSLLRLGQSLAAMNQKEAACATLAEVGRKFPRASASVKRGVTQEQKRAHC